MTKNRKQALKASLIAGAIAFCLSLMLAILQFIERPEKVSLGFSGFMVVFPMMLVYILKFNKLQRKDEINDAKKHGISNLIINYRKEGIKYALYVGLAIFTGYLLIAVNTGIDEFISTLKKDNLYLGGIFYFGGPMLLTYLLRVAYLKEKLCKLQYYSENPNGPDYPLKFSNQEEITNNHNINISPYKDYLRDDPYYFMNYYTSSRR